MNNLDLMKNRLYYQGGIQQNRMIKDKYTAFQRSLLYSYQSGNIKRLNDGLVCRALINPNKLKPDYDDKIISVDNCHNFKPGDIFEWVGTNTHWIIYLQEMTELAYFRGDIRKCSLQISWKKDGVEKSTYAAIRGPVETDIRNIQKNKISVDTPNYSLHILVPNNQDTIGYFKRYARFYLQQPNKGEDKICWRVETIDSISMPGILEIMAEEYYANETNDDIENGIANGKIEELENNTDNIIIGETRIKPRKMASYFVSDQISNGKWKIQENTPVKIISKTDTTIELKWDASYSGSFDLSYGDYTRTIIVESLF